MAFDIDLSPDDRDALMELVDSPKWDSHFLPMLTALEEKRREQVARGSDLPEKDIRVLQGQCKILGTLRELRGTLTSMKRG